MLFPRPNLSLIAGLFCCLATVTAADQTLLKDGSTIAGTVRELTEGVLHVETAFAGTLLISWEHVTGLSTEGVFIVNPEGGSPRVGRLQVTNGQQQLIPNAGDEIPLTLTEIVSLQPDTPTPDTPSPPVPPKNTPETTKADTAPEPTKKLWSGRADMGINGQSGNKERIDVRLGIDLNRKLPKGRVNLYLKGQYAETNSEKSANEVMGGTRLEIDISERTYVFGKVDLEYDEFEDLDFRTTLTSGMGHFFIKREKLELKGWVGAGYEHETFTVEAEPLPDPTTPEDLIRQALILATRDSRVTTTEDEAVVELGYAYRKDFKQNFRFKHGLTYYPAVGAPFEEYRLAADTGFEFPLGKEPDWVLRTGIRHEFDAMPREEIDKLDTTYYLNLGYKW